MLFSLDSIAPSPTTFTTKLAPTLQTTLHLLPLLSTTASLTHAYMESVTTSAFLTPPRTNSALTRAIVKSTTPIPPPDSSAADDVTRAGEVLIPVWFVNFFHVGVTSVVGLNAITLVSGAANLLLKGTGRRGGEWVVRGRARQLYCVGLVAAAAHYAFVPAVAGSVGTLFRMCVMRGKAGKGRKEAQSSREEREKKGARKRKAKEYLAEWGAAHRMRMGSVDLLAWACYFGGVVLLVGK